MVLSEKKGKSLELPICMPIRPLINKPSGIGTNLTILTEIWHGLISEGQIIQPRQTFKQQFYRKLNISSSLKK